MADASIDDVLNELGFGRMQLIIFVSCMLQQIYVTNEHFGLGLVSVASSCDFDIDDHKMAWLMAAVFVAQVGSSHYMGYKSDEIGRRSGMALLTYMSEFTAIKQRPKVTNFLSYAVALSMIYSPLMAMWLLALNIHINILGSYSFTSWRALMLAHLIPGTISWILIYSMPESPKYYLSIGETAKALEVLEKCCRYNKGKDVTLKSLGFETVTQPRLRGDSTTPHRFLPARMWYETKPLLQGDYRRYMLLILTILFLLFGISFCSIVWMPRMLKMQNTVHEDLILCDLVAAAGVQVETLNKTAIVSKCIVMQDSLIFLGSCCLAMFVLASVLLICLKRKVILLAFAIVAAFAGFLLNFIESHALLVTTFVFLSVPPLCSLRLILSVLIDVIPTHLRSKSVALAMMFGRVGVLAANLFMGYTLEWNCFVTFNTFVVILLISLVLITFLPSDADILKIAI